MNYLFLSGSYHSNSRSLAILENIRKYFIKQDIEIPSLNEIPYYCEDLNKNKPEKVIKLIEKVKSADGIIVCTPEYNHSIPAVLKNAIDWLSRPAYNSVLKAKPVAIITQAPSPVGGARAQAHLKLILDATLAKIHTYHEMMITNVDGIFDQNMKIVDSDVLRRLERYIKSFQEFAS